MWTIISDRSAVEAAKLWRFEPARVEDRPVASDLVVTVPIRSQPLNHCAGNSFANFFRAGSSF